MLSAKKAVFLGMVLGVAFNVSCNIDSSRFCFEGDETSKIRLLVSSAANTVMPPVSGSTPRPDSTEGRKTPFYMPPVSKDGTMPPVSIMSPRPGSEEGRKTPFTMPPVSRFVAVVNN